MWILTLKKSDRKPGTQNKKTVSQKSKAGGMQLVPEQQGHHWVRSADRREEVADATHRALQGMEAQQPVASSFLMSSWCCSRLWKGIKKGKKEKRKKWGKQNSCIFCIIMTFFHDTLSKQGVEGNFLNLIKTIHEQLAANMILNDQSCFPLQLRNQTSLSPLAISIKKMHWRFWSGQEKKWKAHRLERKNFN